MTDAEFLAELAEREALIVHCSRPGKGDEGIGGLMFPCDLKNAIDICANKSTELCCSVIWPGHVETFGGVGIVMKPRSTASVTSICTTDSGSRVNPATGKRTSAGSPFCRQAVMDTFTRATSYNEWNVENADTIGIFLHPSEPWEVGRRVPITKVPGYDPAMANLFPNEEVVSSVLLNLQSVTSHFPNLPIYSLTTSGIIRLAPNGGVLVKAADLYF